MLEYVQCLCMHAGVAPMFENIETPYNICIDREDINKGTKNMANGKAIDVTLIASEVIKWTILSTHH